VQKTGTQEFRGIAGVAYCIWCCVCVTELSSFDASSLVLVVLEQLQLPASC
jgi:hypothetical protein